MNKTIQENSLKTPQILDLFSGCGGMSYGFYLEGINVFTGIEIDKHACQTISYNLHWKNGIDKEHLNNDISEVDIHDLELNSSKPVITIGGPPCQAYSRIGKSKIRSLGEHRYGLNDNRAYLYQEFIRLALSADSQAVVMENVPESVNFFGMNIPQIVCDSLEENGYNAIWTILNAADFGVPQTRERVFVIAVKKELGEIEILPTPTNRSPINIKKYKEKFNKFTKFTNFKIPIFPDESLPKWITVRDALLDLPALFLDSNTSYTFNKMTTKLPYQTPPLNDYQEKMRKVTENEFKDVVDGNSFRNTPRDFRIFERMLPGDDYKRAYEIAMELFKEACEFYNVSINDSEAYDQLMNEYVPPYDTSKFLSKWKRLDPDKPSHTLVAHLGVDTYSHIHPWEPRGISVREAARLQSFPDDFIFNVPMGAAFTQIGNAVPPLLSKAVAKAVLKNLSLTTGGKKTIEYG